MDDHANDPRLAGTDSGPPAGNEWPEVRGCPRIPRPTPDELGEQARRVYDTITTGPRADGAGPNRITDDAGRLEGPFNAMLVNPALGDALQSLGAAIRYRTALPDRAREVAILQVAVLRGSAFEWYAHAPLARAAGLTEVDLAAIRTGDPAPGGRPDDQLELVRAAVRSLIEHRDLDDELFAGVRDAFGLDCAVELIHLVGYYDLLALSMRACRVPLPAGAHAEL